MSEIAEVLEEAAELVGQYGGPVPSTWERNLEVMGLLMVVHLVQVGPEATMETLLDEAAVFMRAAFRMGAAGAGVMEVDDGVG